LQFDQIIGQEKLKKQLENSLASERIPHAQLFVGKDGYGGLALALAYIEKLMVSSSSDPSGTKLKCENLVHPDVHFVFPVNRNDEVKDKPISSKFLPKWREAVKNNPYMSYQSWLSLLDIGNRQAMINVEESQDIIRQLTLKPYESEFKVLIIWHAEKMNPSAANKLLKIIEEPPQKTIFILLAESTEHMLPTVLSRTQISRLSPIKSQDLSSALMANEGADAKRAEEIAHLSDGNYTRALELLNEDEFSHNLSEHFKHWMRTCFKKDVAGLIEFSDATSKMSREAQKSLLLFGLRIFRESLMLNYAGDAVLYSSQDLLQWIQNFAPYVNHKTCMYFQKEFDQALHHLERNANPKILFMDLSIKCMRLFKLAKQAT